MADNGVHTFTVTLNTANNQSVTGTDGSITGNVTVVVTGPFKVTSTNDSGAGSLRQALLNANAFRGHNTITFAIGTGVQTITLLSPLPAITNPVTIDGTTQPGYAGRPLIELSGARITGPASGLVLNADNSTVKELAINHFSTDGIELLSSNNVIQGSCIGTDVTGTKALGNAADGIWTKAANNTIGGTPPGAGNIILANLRYGVEITSDAATGNLIQGNDIGIDGTGSVDLGNGLSGVGVFSARNTIGGLTAGARNIIAGNHGYHGVLLSGASARANLVQGNFIGTDFTGTKAVANAEHGVLIDGGSNNTIGGTDAAARNIIAGNGNAGLAIDNAGAQQNLVQGNYIGVDVSGTRALANGSHGNDPDGILIRNAPNNVIGGTTAATRNVISGNRAVGVYIDGVSTGNAVQGNCIGTDATCTAALGNGLGGVLITDAANNNLIGGTATGAGNIISANGGNGGIDIRTTGNVVQGNYIGTDATGTKALGNALAGVRLANASHNIIGGTTAGARNVISGNLGGIDLEDGGTSNVVQGNFIGTDVAGMHPLGNAASGVLITGAASNTLIGGTVAGSSNIIAANGDYGLEIDSDDSSIRVQGNYIGTDVTGTVRLGNVLDGVRIYGPNNTIGGTLVGAGNTIAFNRGAGVYVTATGNAIQRNSIHDNTHLGIDGNGLPLFPVIASATTAGNSTTVVGTLAGVTNTQFTIEFFANTACDPSGYGQGETYVATRTVMTNDNGQASFTYNLDTPAVAPGRFLSATATGTDNTTSKFAQCRQVSGVAQHLRVAAPASSIAGVALPVTVTALDASGYTVVGYTGTVHFTSTDGVALLPADYTFTAADGGQHTFTVVLTTAGSHTITVTDTATNTITGNTSVTVDPAAASRFQLDTPRHHQAGHAFTLTVTARDPYGNIDVHYQGTITFSSSDPNAVLPADYTFTPADQGVVTFPRGATLFLAGQQTIAVTDDDTGLLTGSATIKVAPAKADHFQVDAPATVAPNLPFDVTITALDPFGNIDGNYLGTVTFATTDPDPGVVLPPDYTFTASDQGVHTFAGGFVLVTEGAQVITATDIGSGITGSATVTVTSGAGPAADSFAQGQSRDSVPGGAMVLRAQDSRPVISEALTRGPGTSTMKRSKRMPPGDIRAVDLVFTAGFEEEFMSPRRGIAQE